MHIHWISGWFCSFNAGHSCSGNPKEWIPMTRIDEINNKKNGYVVANINNGSSNSVLRANLNLLSNRGTINIRYRFETFGSDSNEGTPTLSISACKSQSATVFSVDRRNCSNWCNDLIRYTCANRSDVEITFKAERGSTSADTTIAIDYVSITQTPDWELSNTEGYNQSKIEQIDSDHGSWSSETGFISGFFRAVFIPSSKEGDIAVFSVRHRFVSAGGFLHLQNTILNDGFLNVSTCLDNVTALSIDPHSMSMHHIVTVTSQLRYDCGNTSNVFFTFTAVRGSNDTLISIDRIRIFEDVSSEKALPIIPMSNEEHSITTATSQFKDDTVVTDVLTDGPNIEKTLTTSITSESTTALGNSSNESTSSRFVIPIVVAVISILVFIFVIVCVVRCLLLRRQQKSEPNSLIAPRTNSQNVYTNPAYVSKPLTLDGSHQPDILDGLNCAPIAVSQETQDSRSEVPGVAGRSIEAVAQDGHRYYSIHGVSGGAEGEDADSHNYSLPFETHSNPSSANPGQSRSNRKIAPNIASDGYASLKKSDDSGNHDYSLPFKADNGYTSIKPRAISKSTQNPVSDDASPGYTSLKRSDDFDGPDYTLLNATQNDSTGVKPPSKSNGMDQVALDGCPKQKSSSDPALNRTSLTKTKGVVRGSINNHDYYSLDQDQSHAYVLLDKNQNDDNSVPSDQAVIVEGEYGRLGTPSSPAVPYDDDDYNTLIHKDHHRIVDKTRPGNHVNKHGALSSNNRSELHSPEIFNDNVYNTLNGGGAPRRNDDGRQETASEYESVDLTSGSAGLPETNDTHYGSIAEHDGDPLLDGDYEEPLHPNITKDEDSVDEKTDRGAADKDVKEQIGTVRPLGAGDYQSLRSDKNVSKNHNDGAGSNGDGLGGEGAQHVPHIIKDPETQQIPLDRNLDAYGPKSDSFDRISPLYHSIKIGNK